MKPNTVIIGIGHPDRGDDALGLIVIDKLKPHLPPEIVTKKCLGDLAQLIEYFEAYPTIFLVDAMVTEAEAGTLHAFGNQDITSISTQCRSSTHAFDLGQTLALAKNLGIEMKDIRLFGIEAEQFEHGQPLSSKVTAQIDNLISTILMALNLSGTGKKNA